MNSWRRFPWWVLGLPLLLPLLVRGLGRRLLYYPTTLSEKDLVALCEAGGFELSGVRHDEGRNLGLVRSARSRESPWILYFGGNSTSLAQSMEILEQLGHGTDWGLAAFAYRGYDGSDGAPTQARLFSDARACVRELERRHGVVPRQLVLVGQSLGSGVAAHVAAELATSKTPSAGLCLLSPYTSIAQVIDDHLFGLPVGWAAPDRYPTEKLVDELHWPVLLIHGDADSLIRIEHSRRLARLLGGRAELLVVEGAGHNELWERQRVLAAVRDLVQGAMKR